MKLTKFFKFEIQISSEPTKDLEDLMYSRELLGQEISEEERRKGSIETHTLALSKSAINVNKVTAVVQQYLDASKISKEEKKDLQEAFIRDKTYKITQVPVLRLHMESGEVIYNVISTIEFFLSHVKDKKNAKNKNK